MPKKQSTTARKARAAARSGEKFTSALRRLSASDSPEVEFSGEIFQWRGPAPYYFVQLPAEQSLEVKAVSADLSYYRGVIRVRARLGDTEWATSLLPRDGRYVLPLKDAVRKPLGLDDGDTITIRLTPIASAVQKKPEPRPVVAAAASRTVRSREPVTDDQLRIVPANKANWEDLQAIFGAGGDPSRCWCQRYKMHRGEAWTSVGADALAARLREQTGCGEPESATTTGLVAYLDEEPVGWCAVDPRAANPRLRSHCRVPWVGRSEDKTDYGIWAVTCFVTRAGYRRRGISRALARAAVDFARERGARALEGYPNTAAVEYVGTRGVFAAAGLVEVNRPTNNRIVMRIDFEQPGYRA